MAIVLASRVALSEGFTPFVGKPAVLELHDDDRLVLSKVNRSTSQVTETILDVPLSEVEIRTESSAILIFAKGKRIRVDLSTARGVAFLAGGAIGMAIAESVAKNDGLQSWVTALRERGVAVKVRKSILPLLLVVLIVLILGISVIVVLVI